MYVVIDLFNPKYPYVIAGPFVTRNAARMSLHTERDRYVGAGMKDKNQTIKLFKLTEVR